jgi:hypothetical protein
MKISEREQLREQWRSVASELGLQFVAPFSLALADGSHWEFAALLPQFGGGQGMLIDSEHSAAAFAAAAFAGYRVSSMLPESHHLPVDASNYIECLVDWGWAGESAAPNWYAGAA